MIRLKPLPLLLLSLPLLFAGPGHAFAADDTQEALNLLTGTDEELVTTSRSPRPISKIAENVTTISRQQIEELNVHTVSELLQTVTGIQFWHNGRTPGQAGNNILLQGADSPNVLVLIDGISQNIHNLWNTVQYADFHYANAGTWLEGGVRIKF